MGTERNWKGKKVNNSKNISLCLSCLSVCLVLSPSTASIPKQGLGFDRVLIVNLQSFPPFHPILFWGWSWFDSWRFGSHANGCFSLFLWLSGSPLSGAILSSGIGRRRTHSSSFSLYRGEQVRVYVKPFACLVCAVQFVQSLCFYHVADIWWSSSLWLLINSSFFKMILKSKVFKFFSLSWEMLAELVIL